MTRLFHRLAILLSALALCLSGAVGSASAAPGLTPVVICGAMGAETIWLDASGTPAEAPQDCRDCPDCLSFPPLVLAPPALLPLPAAQGLRIAWPQGATVPAPRPDTGPLARGPPAPAVVQLPVLPASGTDGALTPRAAATRFPKPDGPATRQDHRAEIEVA